MGKKKMNKITNKTLLALAVSAVLQSGLISASEEGASEAKKNEMTESSETKASTDEADTNEGGLENVIVTSRKRPESLQDVPSSISTVNNEELKRIGAQSLFDLESLMPNITFTGGQDSKRNTRIVIRGLSTESSNVGLETGVGVSIDGVNMGRSASFNQSMSDIERVEALRGPQGTLQGKNTIAGAINIITKKPDGTTGGFVEVEAGNFNEQQIKARAEGTLNENEDIFAKISLLSITRDGISTNVYDGQDVETVKTQGARLQIVSEATDSLELVLSIDALHDELVTGGGTLIDGGPFLGPYMGVLNSEYAGGPPPGPETGKDTSLPTGRNVNMSETGVEERDIYGVALTATYDMSEGYTLTSITAWRSLDAYESFDFDYSAFQMLHGYENEEQTQFSQELRIAGDLSDDSRIVAGLYYFQQDAEGSAEVAILPQLFVFTGIPGAESLIQNGDVSTKSFALFGNYEYDLTDTLILSVGARVMREDKEIVYNQTPGSAIYIGFPEIELIDDFSETNTSPTVTLSYKASENVNTYVRVSKGYKSGGWNAGLVKLQPEQLAFDSESVTNYEVGFKTQFFDNKARVNAAIFLMDYDDMQVLQSRVIDGSSSDLITNAGEATSKGIEIDYNFILTENLSMKGGVAFVDATYDTFDTEEDGEPISYAGNQLTSAPEYSYSIGLLHDIPLESGSSIVSSLIYSYRDDSYLNVQNTEDRKVEGYGLVIASIGFISPNGDWDVTLWGKNLTDEEYLTSRRTDNMGLGLVLDSYGMPRTYGLRAAYHF